MSTPVADAPVSPTSPSTDETGPPPKRQRRSLVSLVAIGALLAIAVGAGLYWHYSGIETTDNAQVEGHVSPVAARVSGTVTEVLVSSNQYVEAGTVLVRLDRRDYEVALARADAALTESEAEAHAAERAVPVISATSSSQESAAASDIAAAEARLAAVRSRLQEAEVKRTLAQQDLERLAPLIAKDEISHKEYDTALTAADVARAAQDAAEADVRETEKAIEAARARLVAAQTGPQQVEIQRARFASQTAKAEGARTDVAAARLDLEHTEVKAPVSGVVSRRTVEVGQVVAAGQPLLALVRLEDVWVVANFKENQLRDIRPGQPVSISVDAYGGRTYRGRVDSISAATGALFSLLPAENATGNYVKVVQRIPVKIVLEADQDPEHLLRPGMSVVPTVVTRSGS